ncbi:MAG: cobalamin-binding protein [Verrucomicrobia bacterium]|nr:MAG: cobalamin-binding protein [Verrucomicrobiota bacterium]
MSTLPIGAQLAAPAAWRGNIHGRTQGVPRQFIWIFLIACLAWLPLGAAERVISLAPSLTEMICAIGAADQLVGRTSACDYPPEPLKAVPVIGGFGAPSLEKLVALQPTLIVDIALEDEALGGQIKRLGLRRERIICRTLDDIPAALRRLGSLLHREVAAEALATQLTAGIAAARQAATAQKNKPLVYAEFWRDPPMTCGKKTFLAELITLAAGENLGDAAARDYFPVSAEWVVARRPDIVLCLYMADEKKLPEQMASRPGWNTLPAVRNKHVYGGFDNNLLLRPGPRALEGLRLLQNCFQAATR